MPSDPFPGSKGKGFDLFFQNKSTSSCDSSNKKDCNFGLDISDIDILLRETCRYNSSWRRRVPSIPPLGYRVVNFLTGLTGLPDIQTDRNMMSPEKDLRNPCRLLQMILN